MGSAVGWLLSQDDEMLAFCCLGVPSGVPFVVFSEIIGGSTVVVSGCRLKTRGWAVSQDGKEMFSLRDSYLFVSWVLKSSNI